MVTRRRLRSALTAIGLYIGAALLIGYFGVNAYTGAHGLKAKQDLAQQIDELSRELARLKVERATWEHRVSLLRADRLDPDLLDERTRAMLAHPHPTIWVVVHGTRWARTAPPAGSPGQDPSCRTVICPARPTRRSALPRFRVLGYGLPTLARVIPRSPMAVAKNKPATPNVARR